MAEDKKVIRIESDLDSGKPQVDEASRRELAEEIRQSNPKGWERFEGSGLAGPPQEPPDGSPPSSPLLDDGHEEWQRFNAPKGYDDTPTYGPPEYPPGGGPPPTGPPPFPGGEGPEELADTFVIAGAEILGAATEIVGGLTLAGLAFVETTQLMSNAVHALIADIEAVSPQVQAARAQQSAELTLARLRASQNVSTSDTQLIEAQTSLEKQLIEFRSLFGSEMARALTVLNYIATWIVEIGNGCLHAIIDLQIIGATIADAALTILSHIPGIGGYASELKKTVDDQLAEIKRQRNPTDAPSDWMKDTIDFFAGNKASGIRENPFGANPRKGFNRKP